MEFKCKWVTTFPRQTAKSCKLDWLRPESFRMVIIVSQAVHSVEGNNYVAVAMLK